MDLLQKSTKKSFADYLVKSETEFLTDFISFWVAIRKSIFKYKETVNAHKVTLDTVKIIKQISKDVFPQITQPFFEKWIPQFSFIQKDLDYLSTYYSYEISFNNFSFLLPHKLIVFELLKPDNSIFFYLKQIKNLNDLLFYITRTFSDMNLNLNSNDEKILNFLTSKEFINAYERYPSQKELAKSIGCSEATYNRRETILAETYLLNPIYRINVDILGFETLYLCSDLVNSNQLDFLETFSLASVPFNFGKTIGVQKIIQYPFTDYNFYNELTTLCRNSNSSFSRITDGYIGWNLLSFHRETKNRWKVPPPILLTTNWDDPIFIEKKGVHYNFIPVDSPPHLTNLEIELLSFFSKYGTRYDVHLAEKFKKTEKYIRRAWKSLLEKKLIHRFPIISNIGLDAKPWVTLVGQPTSDFRVMNNMILKIVEHLKLFPFSFLFYRLSQDSDDAPPLLTGLLYFPTSWMTEFNIKWAKLAEFGFIPSIEFSYNRELKWNVNISPNP